ncbi:Cerato-platanin [Amylostereum chailletii]|nr:Cerato-platanin [Amylostereum chailletii]
MPCNIFRFSIKCTVKLAFTAMQFLATLSTLILAAASAYATTVSYDQTYDNKSGLLTTVACSDGPQGLIPHGYNDFGDLPTFPHIGGASAIAGWGSTSCGSCWHLTYQGKTITVLAIDHTDDGFNLSLEAMNDLTDGQAEFLGRVDATATQVDRSQCGLDF